MHHLSQILLFLKIKIRKPNSIKRDNQLQKEWEEHQEVSEIKREE